MESAGSRNNQVSLRELHGYLKANVDQWVIENRDDRQEPMLLPEDAPDVPLVFRGSSQGTILPRRPRATTAGTRWRRSGRSTAQLRAKTPYRTKPMEWAAFQGDLLRAGAIAASRQHVSSAQFNETIARLTSEAAALDRCRSGHRGDAI